VGELHMAEQVAKVKARARPWKSIIAVCLAVLAASGSVLADQLAGSGEHDHTLWKMISAGAALAFLLFGLSATMGLSGKAREMLVPRIGSSHATMVRLVLVLAGVLATLLWTLQLFHIGVGQLVLGTAVTGVLLGIAAQQTLANLFAGIVLMLARPFVVGDDIQLRSGALGGEYNGTVLDIGLTYVRLESELGLHNLPNAQVLAAGIGPRAPLDPVDPVPAAGAPSEPAPRPADAEEPPPYGDSAEGTAILNRTNG
jgi:small-conductance mechanosensitive channel